MTEPRIHVDAPLAPGADLELPAAAHRHLVKVLRRGPGDLVALFDGQGHEFGAVLEEVGAKRARARVLDARDADRESPLDVTLALGVSKGDRMDWAVQKAVELGARAIVPVRTERSVVRLSDGRWAHKRAHWKGVAVAACEQCGRNLVPDIAEVIDLDDWSRGTRAGTLALVLAPGGPRTSLPGDPPASTTVLVGPEGGLTDRELRRLDEGGFRRWTLGPRTLRTETAGIVALSLLQQRWGDLDPRTREDALC